MNDKKKILIVEDEKSQLEALKERFSSEGSFSIIEARNGKEGLEKALSEHPDLILLDVMMPIVDGVSMLKELRKDDWGKNVKAIILSNLNPDEKIFSSIDLDSTEHLLKADSKIKDIVEKVKETLEI